MKRLKVGILGATGMVGQRFITLLENHPWFDVAVVAASPRSAGKPYHDAVRGRWAMTGSIPDHVSDLMVMSVEDDVEDISQSVDFVFSALDLEKDKIRAIEDAYAAHGVPVVSNNSAHRWTEDVPMIIPEVNEHHTDLINLQRKKRGWNKGFIAVKPNCSIQSYVIILNALMKWKPKDAHVTSLQAISGAGKTFETWPEMIDNVIPFIGGEEEKSEKEPMKIWAHIGEGDNVYVPMMSARPNIAATCIRVPVSDGHMASVSVSFEQKPSKDEIIKAVEEYDNPIAQYNLPSAPSPVITYLEDDDRPQTKVDRGTHNGMGVTMGRLREDQFFGWRFIALSHNTVRGAAGGAILVAELLKAKGFI